MQPLRFSILLVTLVATPIAIAGICDPKLPRDCVGDDHDVKVNSVDMDIAIEHVFAPRGFDTNDDAEAMASGWLPSPCYQSPRAEVKRVGNVITISARAAKKTGRGQACIAMAVPFLMPLDLGHLEQGDFVIQFGKELSNPKQVTLSVEAPQSDNVDNFVYAHIERVSVDETTRQITLAGRNPSDCLELDRIDTLSNHLDTYAILPIMKQVRADCPKVMVPFHYVLDLPGDLDAEKILLHVRSLEGKAVNYLWDNP